MVTKSKSKPKTKTKTKLKPKPKPKPKTKPTKAAKPAKKAPKPQAALVDVSWRELYSLVGKRVAGPEIDSLLAKLGSTRSRMKYSLDRPAMGFCVFFVEAAEVDRTDVPPETQIVHGILITTVKNLSIKPWVGELPHGLPRDLTMDLALAMGKPSVDPGFVDIERDGIVVSAQFDDDGKLFEIHTYCERGNPPTTV